MKVLLTGGQQRKKLLSAEDAEHRFERALIVSLDLGTGEARTLLEYEGDLNAPVEARASVLFTSCTLHQDKLFVCTYTEVLTYTLPDFRLEARISLPCFNSLHHVSVTDSGTLLVVNTGLDMVMELSTNGQILREWDVSGEGGWAKFSKDIDYRLRSTKPHVSHPNYVSQIGNEIWVTRLKQKDAICLTTQHRKIDIAVERPHDGVLYRNELYFTTVDGHIVVADPYTGNVTKVFDLRQDSSGQLLPGWCRGVIRIDDDHLLIGFTRIRKAALMERLLWLKHGFRTVDVPTHVVLYNTTAARCIKQVNVEKLGLNILFGIVAWS